MLKAEHEPLTKLMTFQLKEFDSKNLTFEDGGTSDLIIGKVRSPDLARPPADTASRRTHALLPAAAACALAMGWRAFAARGWVVSHMHQGRVCWLRAVCFPIYGHLRPRDSQKGDEHRQRAFAV